MNVRFAGPIATRFARERIMENAFSMYRQREALFGDPRCLMQTRAARSLVRPGLNGNFYIKVGKSVTGILVFVILSLQ